MTPANDQAATDYAPPANELEHALVAIWSEVLGIERARVGVETFFMDLGGTSILLKQVLVRINDEYQAGLLIPDLFKFATIRELADRLANKPATTPAAIPAQGDRRRAALLARRQQANR
jgi:iturin family lipopeptide synthetase A